MNVELVIYPQGDGLCCVLLEDGRPVEMMTEDGALSSRRQDILLGQVRQVMPALASVFVDIGDEHDAMLPLGEAPANVKAGQPIIVQVRRETAASKGQQVTTHIQLPGPFAVYNPAGAPKHRTKLKAFDLARQKELYESDLARLQVLWASLLADSRKGRVPRPLLAAGEPLYSMLINGISPTLTQIRVEGDGLFNRVYELVKTIMPPYLPLLKLYVPRAGYGLSAALGLSDLADSLYQRKVWLDNGGFLVIDRTEALTVIDVNSGKDIKGKHNDALRLRTNQAAALEIARQLRLRNLGGNFVIDFLNMDELSRQTLLETLTDSLSRDRAHCRLIGFTGLGLLEMSRTAV